MDISIDEKRVYGGDGESAPVYVVGEFGVAVVETSDDLVGEFGLERRCTARDAAGGDGRVAVATDEDVLVGSREGFESLGVGPAVAVGFAGGDLLVAREDGAVVRGRDEASWTRLGELPDVRAVDGAFLATGDGVYRATDDGLAHVGLDAARDVSAAGAPLAATDGGLFRLGNGWLAEREGAFRAVAGGSDGWAHAAGEAGLVCYEDGSWREVALPVDGEVVALDHGNGAYAMTADGTFLLSVGDGWRSQPVGLREARAVAAP